MFSCQHCPKTFGTEYGRFIHTRRIHKSVNVDPPEGRRKYSRRKPLLSAAPAESGVVRDPKDSMLLDMALTALRQLERIILAVLSP